MGLKCSVLGHAFGETTIEREREEQGSEVVITIQETETCERCGETRVVSENKEVTAIETPSDIAGDMVDDEAEAVDEADDAGATERTTGGDGEAADATAAEAPSGDVDVDQQGEDAEFIDESGDAEPGAAAGTGDDDGFADTEPELGETSETADVDGEDAEILDDSDEGNDTEAAGDAELGDPTTDVTVPDAEEEAVTDAETDPETDDGVIIDESGAERATDEDREPGQWPSEPGDDGDDWSPEMLTDEQSADDETDSDQPGGGTVTVPDGEFYCPECGFTTDVEASSLRAGDFCPECHKGSLVTGSE